MAFQAVPIGLGPAGTGQVVVSYIIYVCSTDALLNDYSGAQTSMPTFDGKQPRVTVIRPR